VTKTFSLDGTQVSMLMHELLLAMICFSRGKTGRRCLFTTVSKVIWWFIKIAL